MSRYDSRAGARPSSEAPHASAATGSVETATWFSVRTDESDPPVGPPLT